MQALLIYLFVDLLQRCRLAQLEALKTAETERILMEEVGSEEPSTLNAEEDGEEVEEADAGLLQTDVRARRQDEDLQPNLHVLGVLFLGKHTSRAFNFVLLFQFVSIGISYVLAGSEAYAALFHTSHVYVIPAFTWTLSLGILLAQIIIQPITSLLTLLKGILLVITVACGHLVWIKFTSNSFYSLSYAARLALHCNALCIHSKLFIKCHDCPQALVSQLADSNSQPRLISGQIPDYQSHSLMYYPCSKCPCLSIIWAVIIYELGFYGAWTAPPASRCESCHLDAAEQPR